MDNLRLYQFLLLDQEKADRYENVFQYAKPVDHINKYKGQKLQSLTFGQVGTLKKLATEREYIQAFQIVFGIPEKTLLKTRIKDFFMALNWLRNEIQNLLENEKLLVIEPDPEQTEAGIDELNIFKDMNILIPLSKEYCEPPEVIAEWRYSTIFTLLYHAKISSEIDRRYSEIMKGKNK